MEIVNLGLLFLITILLILLIFKIQSNKQKIDEEKLVDKISLNISKNQTEESLKLLNHLNSSTKEQSEMVHNNLQNLEQRFGQVQVKLTQDMGDNMERMQTVMMQRIQSGLNGVQEVNKNNFQLLAKTNNDKLSQIQLEVEKRLDENLARNLKAFGEVKENIGQMQNTAQRMIDSTKSVDKLNSIFERTASKSFGNFGEKYLESLLTENLSEHSWSSQVAVPGSGDKIDFMIEVDGKRIGIDSKFPVTKYRDYTDAPLEEKDKHYKEFLRQVAEMAKSINDKYNKTSYFDILLVYLPSDSMYVEVANNEVLSKFLASIKVSPVSPNTIFPLISTLSLHQKRAQISDNAERIIQGLQIVKKHMEAFSEEFRKLGDKLRTAQDNYDKAGKSLFVVDREVLQLETLNKNKELENLDK